MLLPQNSFIPTLLTVIVFASASGVAEQPNESRETAIANPSDPVAGKHHWAFRPLERKHVVTLESDDWSRTAIDRFVLARQRSEGLRPATDAEARDLVRRSYFQLIGLPPTQQDLDTYLEDDRPDAFERLVDRLLASPLFGQRWTRHWLDLARYADSNGLDENFLFREAWRYRNWVIDVVNADMPFDRFLLEQIAGDQLPFESIEQRDRQRIAAGFLVIGPKVLLGNDEQNQRMEVADELIDTIGRVVLGQTLGCARCHDHKFDPVPTADYYSLAGIFASTRVMERRYMLGEQRQMERLVGLGAHGSAFNDAYEAYWREQPKLGESKKQAELILDEIKKGNEQAIAAIVRNHPESLADNARQSLEQDRSTVERIAAQTKLIAELLFRLNNPPKIPPRAMIPVDVEAPADEYIRLAGEFNRRGDRVPRGFLNVLCDAERIEIPSNQSGRAEFSRWLTNGNSRTGQLAARVLVNRIWHHLIGRGLVRTVDNFGRTGELPSHPDLLEHLAGETIKSGWSIKSMIRQIVASRTFGLASHHVENCHAIDPDNRFLWRANRRRLDPESYRDAMLLVAGRLDPCPMESTVSYLGDQATAVGPNTVRRRTDFPCRSIYLPVIRNDLPEIFEVFDFANPHTAVGARPNTTSPNQGLFMLNDAMVMDAADEVARRILSDTSTNSEHDSSLRIELMFSLITGTQASDDLRQQMRSFLWQMEVRLKSQESDKPEFRALAIACHALFASSQFQFLE